MIGESDTPEQGTDTAQPQADDTASEWDYFDPDEEDQDTEESPEPEATDDGTEVAEEVASTDEPAEVEASTEAIVTMQDGTKVKVADLIKGQLRQDDYTRKMQAHAQERQALRAEVERIEGITAAIVDHFEKIVPPAPDHSVALRDPAKYTREMAIHQAAMAQLQNLIELGQKPREIKDSLSKEDKARLEREENAQLAAKFPETTTQQGREKFFTEAAGAASELGITMDDLRGVTDHRYFVALHYAAKGLKAERAMQAATAKVAKAPPVAPQKPPAVQAKNADAVRKFHRNPSLKYGAMAWDGES